MQDWPKDINVESVFVGKELETITFAQYSLYLNFQGGVALSVFSDFCYFSAGESENTKFPIKTTHVISLIGSKVIKAQIVESRNLNLFFENNGKLEINGATVGYDCYSVKYDGNEFYV